MSIEHTRTTGTLLLSDTLPFVRRTFSICPPFIAYTFFYFARLFSHSCTAHNMLSLAFGDFCFFFSLSALASLPHSLPRKRKMISTFPPGLDRFQFISHSIQLQRMKEGNCTKGMRARHIKFVFTRHYCDNNFNDSEN